MKNKDVNDFPRKHVYAVTKNIGQNLESYKDVPLMEFMYLVFTRMPDESYRRRLRSLLLYLCYVFRGLIFNAKIIGGSNFRQSCVQGCIAKGMSELI